MGAELPYQICEIGAIYRMWCNTQNTHLPCQSTPSLRKVTCPITLYTLFCLFQSTPSLWKVTAREKMVTAKFQISIHTFLAEGDQSHYKGSGLRLNFNPHLPCGRWRLSHVGAHKSLNISIHTFLAEGDITAFMYTCQRCDFNPHLPCGRWLVCFVFL